jgi:hypothetical protein
VDTSTPRTWSTSTPKKYHFNRFCGDTQKRDFRALEDKHYYPPNMETQEFTSSSKLGATISTGKAQTRFSWKWNIHKDQKLLRTRISFEILKALAEKLVESTVSVSITTDVRDILLLIGKRTMQEWELIKFISCSGNPFVPVTGRILLSNSICSKLCFHFIIF